MQALEASFLLASADASELAEEQAVEASCLLASADASGLAEEQALEACPLQLVRLRSCSVALAPQRASLLVRLSEHLS